MANLTKGGKGFLLFLAGLLIGVLLAAGLELTGQGVANPSGQGREDSLAKKTASGGALTTAPAVTVSALSNAFADVAERVNPAVVTISTESVFSSPSADPPNSPFDDFFRRFYPDEGLKQQGLGSGVVVKADGVILTNNHVIDQASNIVVQLFDGRKLEAEVIGKDARTDLAVIRIEAQDLPVLELGNSEAIRVGEWVLAIGSPLQEELAHTVTAGIISAKGRAGVGLSRYEDFLQTDAAINPGNSGGALVNLRGELVGINTAIASRSGGSIGIGFAIPSNLARKVMGDILARGKVVRGWLGVGIQNVSAEVAERNGLKSTDGVVIQELMPNGPARDAGLEAGDIVLEVDGRKIHNTTELSTRIGASEPGSIVRLKLVREGQVRLISVVLDEFPDEQPEFAAAPRQSVAFLGMEVALLSDPLRRRFRLQQDDAGVVITTVNPRGPAGRGGLQTGDLILSINRKAVGDISDFNSLIADIHAGDALVFYIKRGEQKLFIAFDLPLK